MAEVRNMHCGGSDEALLHRLFELACDRQADDGELARVQAIVHARLLETYGGAEPPPPAPGGAARSADGLRTTGSAAAARTSRQTAAPSAA